MQAKKAAEDASKQAIQASKHAADASKTTLGDLTYVGRSTIGDLTKTAKDAATKKGLMKSDNMNQPHQQQQYSSPVQHHQQQQQQQFQQPENSLVTHNSGLFSSFSSEINGIASSTSSMFTDFFGKSEQFCIRHLQSSMNHILLLFRATRKPKEHQSTTNATNNKR